MRFSTTDHAEPTAVLLVTLYRITERGRRIVVKRPCPTPYVSVKLLIESIPTPARGLCRRMNSANEQPFLGAQSLYPTAHRRSS